MRNVQPTLNPDSSLWKDLVLFDRVSTKIRHEYKRGDVVALQYVKTRCRLVSCLYSLTLSRFIQFTDQP